MNKERLTYLFRQHCNATATAEERNELMTVLRTRENDDLLRGIMDEYIKNEEEDMFLDDSSADEMLDAIFEAGKGKVVSIAPRRKSITRIAIAASIALFIATGILYFFLQKSGNNAGKAATKNNIGKTDLPPGRNGAILQLAGGKTIVLDTAGSGELYAGAAAAVNKSGEIVNITPSGSNSPVEYNLLSTPRGRQQEIVLSDGTKVWLNAASSLRFPTVFMGKERLVEITGEAYFEVKHNSQMPFKVKAGRQLAEDIGTAFNVNAYPDEGAIRTTLIEGSIMVSADHNARRFPLATSGQQAVTKGNEVSIVNQTDTEEVIAWKNGLFKFHGAGLGTIIRQAGRWYDVDIEIRDTITTRFDGEIERNVNASQLLQILELTGKVHFEIKDRKIIVKR